MGPAAIAQYGPRVIGHLADPALRSIVLACLAALALGAFRVRQVTVQLAVWTAVLYAALAMPLLAWLAPGIPVPLRVPELAAANPISSAAHVGEPHKTAVVEGAWRPSRTASAERKTAIDRQFAGPASGARAGNGSKWPPLALPLRQSVRQGSAAGRLPQLASRVGRELGQALARLPRPAPSTLLVAAYTLGIIFLLGRLAVGLFLSRRLRRTSTRITDPRALRWLEHYAAPKLPPALAESPSVSVPLTLGIRHPVIVIPSGWREWQSAKLAAVIAHEVSHVRRNDSRTRTLALLYRCFFWFNPLGWWLEHRLADLAEQASDQAAIRAGAEPIYYAEVLMSFFEISTRHGRVNWQSVAMAHGRRAGNRIERVLASGAALPPAMKARFLVLLALCALPLVWLTAATRPMLVAHASAATSESPSETGARLRVPALPLRSTASARAFSQATPSPWPAAAAPTALSGAVVELGEQSTPVPATPSLPIAFLLPPAVGPSATPEPASRPALSAKADSVGNSQSSSATNSEEDNWLLSYVNRDDGTDITLTNRFDTRGEEALRKKLGDSFILFHHQGNSYVIQDAATVKAAYSLFAPEAELGKQQAELGKQQEELGRQQEALGKQQEAARVNLPGDLVERLQKVEAEIRALGASASQDDLGRLQGELGDIQGYLGELQGKAGNQQGELGRRQGALGAQQGELGRKQGELGEEQERLRQEGFRKMQEILKRALASGLAQRAPA